MIRPPLVKVYNSDAGTRDGIEITECDKFDAPETGKRAHLIFAFKTKVGRFSHLIVAFKTKIGRFSLCSRLPNGRDRR